MQNEYYFNDYVWENIKSYLFPTKLHLMKKIKKKYRDWTKYPNIFVFYWGAFQTNVNIKIILNRNRFVKDYNIKRRSILPKYVEIESGYHTFNNDFFDHFEYYLDKDKNYILITSPYHANFIFNGWKKIYKLYNENADTFLIKILSKNNRKKEKKLKEELEKLSQPLITELLI